MTNVLLWMGIYSLILALSQVMLKAGATQIGGFSLKGAGDIIPFLFSLIRNPLVLLGTTMMASSYFLWVYILSWVKLSIALPLTALAYVLAAFLSYFLLGEKLLLINYTGIALIAGGIFFLLYK